MESNPKWHQLLDVSQPSLLAVSFLLRIRSVLWVTCFAKIVAFTWPYNTLWILDDNQSGGVISDHERLFTTRLQSFFLPVPDIGLSVVLSVQFLYMVGGARLQRMSP